MKIKEYIEKNFNLKDLEISNNSNFTKEDYLNAKVDAIQCLETMVTNWMVIIFFRYLRLYSRALKNLHTFVTLMLTKL